MKGEMQEASELNAIAGLARRSIEPGLQSDAEGRTISAGACLHASMVVLILLRKFSRAKAVVRGGPERQGAKDVEGKWRGHYWVETDMPSGERFVVDVTADQFGHEPVVVLPVELAGERYKAGEQGEVDEALMACADEFGCSELLAA